MSVVVNLPDELSRRVEVAAALAGVSPEQWVIEAIDAGVPEPADVEND